MDFFPVRNSQNLFCPRCIVSSILHVTVCFFIDIMLYLTLSKANAIIIGECCALVTFMEQIHSRGILLILNIHVYGHCY